MGWIEFFLLGSIEQAKLNTRKAENILRLYNRYKEQDANMRSYYFIRVLDFIFQHPIFTASQLLAENNLSAKQTMYNLLKKLCNAGIIKQIDSIKNKTYICRELLSIVDSQ